MSTWNGFKKTYQSATYVHFKNFLGQIDKYEMVTLIHKCYNNAESH